MADAKDLPTARSIESFERAVKRKEKKLKGKYSRSFYRKIMDSDVRQYIAIKFLLHFPIGLILGFVFFKATLDRLQFPMKYSIPVSLLFILAFAISFAIFVTFRCLAVLLFPYIFGETGRLYVYALCLGLLITGPCSNIMVNTQEVLRSLGCNFEIFVNVTKSRIAIRVVPLIDSLINILENQVNLTSTASEIGNIFSPMKLEMMLDKDGKEMAKQAMEEAEYMMELSQKMVAIENKYRHVAQFSRLKRAQKIFEEKVELQCNELLNMGVRGCAMAMKKAYRNCLNKIFLRELVCWPLLITQFCKLLEGIFEKLGFTCDPIFAITSKLSEQVDSVDGLALQMEKQFDANIQFAGDWIQDNVGLNELGSEQEGAGFVTRTILWQFKIKRKLFELGFRIIQRLVVLLFVFVVYRAQAYQWGYLTVIDFDNHIITDYFRHIDRRRRLEDKRTLLPLKKLEQKEYTYGCSFSLTDKEKANMLTSCARGIFVICLALSILLFDYLLAATMDLVAGAIKVDFIQKGRHSINYNITGDGIMAKLVRTIFRGFNSTYTIDNVLTNEECLPQSSRLAWLEIYILIFCLCLIMVSALIEIPVMRTRRVICDFFYYKHHKKRTLYLYNTMLKRRVGFLHEARHRVRRQCKKDTFYLSMTFLTALRYQFPGKFEWLTRLGFGKQQCLICGDREDPTFIHCPTFRCKATYCRQCWIDVNARCYACRDEDDWTVVSSEENTDQAQPAPKKF